MFRIYQNFSESLRCSFPANIPFKTWCFSSYRESKRIWGNKPNTFDTLCCCAHLLPSHVNGSKCLCEGCILWYVLLPLLRSAPPKLSCLMMHSVKQLRAGFPIYRAVAETAPKFREDIRASLGMRFSQRWISKPQYGLSHIYVF